ncbi:MAG TPA: phosphoribosyltransferase family protein [Burkholderiaceae bacterium]|nr:phosphoribosyltransferase family protein [Burkholderiaceae bacterium]
MRDDGLPFQDRVAAGRALGVRLAAMGLADPVVLALPRGGVPVGLEVARALNAPLDLLLVRKIGVPWQPELAVGAVMDGDEPVVVVEPHVQAEARIDGEYIERRAWEELKEIERRRALYLAQRAPEPVAGHTAIVVDDGIATGTTMRAALRGLRRRRPTRLVLAVPVAPPETIDALRAEVDDVVCLAQPERFGAIGYFYRDFHQLTDDEVIALMRQAPASRAAPPRSARWSA